MAVLLSLTVLCFFFDPEGLLYSVKVVSPDCLIQLLEPTWRLYMSRSLSATILKHFLKAKRMAERRWIMYWGVNHKKIYVIREKK